MESQTLEKIDRIPLRERVYNLVQRAIVSGELHPGQRVRDLDLAAQLGVSRTPVREALQRLEDEGLVETLPGALTRIVPLDTRAAREAFPVVAVLHALATRLAVETLTEHDLASLRQANESLVAALETGDVTSAVQADDRFLAPVEELPQLVSGKHRARLVEPHVRVPRQQLGAKRRMS